MAQIRALLSRTILQLSKQLELLIEYAWGDLSSLTKTWINNRWVRRTFLHYEKTAKGHGEGSTNPCAWNFRSRRGRPPNVRYVDPQLWDRPPSARKIKQKKTNQCICILLLRQILAMLEDKGGRGAWSGRSLTSRGNEQLDFFLPSPHSLHAAICSYYRLAASLPAVAEERAVLAAERKKRRDSQKERKRVWKMKQEIRESGRKI